MNVRNSFLTDSKKTYLPVYLHDLILIIFVKRIIFVFKNFTCYRSCPFTQFIEEEQISMYERKNICIDRFEKFITCYARILMYVN